MTEKNIMKHKLMYRNIYIYNIETLSLQLVTIVYFNINFIVIYVPYTESGLIIRLIIQI